MSTADLKRAKKLLTGRPDLVDRLLRIADHQARPKTPVCTAAEAASIFSPLFDGLGDEELHAIYLDRRHQLMCHRRLTVGSDRFTVVDPRQIYRPAIEVGAAAVILAHNHPSGDVTPSAQDSEVTRRVGSAGRVLGVTLLDHLVFGLGHSGWTSMREVGAMDTYGSGEGSSWTA